MSLKPEELRAAIDNFLRPRGYTVEGTSFDGYWFTHKRTGSHGRKRNGVDTAWADALAHFDGYLAKAEAAISNIERRV